MKKLALAVVVMLATGFGLFAQSAEYTALLKKAKDYEAKKQYASALGAYYDAVAAEPTEKSKEAQDAFLKLEAVIKGGNPGYGDFDEFSIYDNWVLLLKDFERYWTENPTRAFYLGQLKKGDIDRTTRTASYSLQIDCDFSKKCQRIRGALQAGLEKSRKNDWTGIPKAQYFGGIDKKYLAAQGWPERSVYENDFKAGKYLVDGTAIFYQDASEIDFIGGGKLNAPPDDSFGLWGVDKRVSPAAFTTSAWFGIDDLLKSEANIVGMFSQNEVSMWAGYAVKESQKRGEDGRSLYDITLAIVDENGKELAKSGRVLVGKENTYTFTGVTQDIMRLIDTGKAKVVPTGLFLEYGKPTGSAIDRGSRSWLKPLPEIKYDVKQAIWSSADDVDVIVKVEKDAQEAAKRAKLLAALNEFTSNFVKIEQGTFSDTNTIRKIFYDEHDIDNWEETIRQDYGSSYFYYDKDYSRNIILSSFLISKNPLSAEVYESITGIKRDHKTGAYGNRISTACMSWYEAVQLCNTLSVKSGLKPCYAQNGNTDVETWKKEPSTSDIAFWNSITCDFYADGYRLPTFAELKCLAQARDVFTVNFSNNVSAYLCWDRDFSIKEEEATKTVIDPVTNKTETSEREVKISTLRSGRSRKWEYPCKYSSSENVAYWSAYLVRSIPSERLTEEQKAAIYADIEKAQKEAQKEAEEKAKAEALAASLAKISPEPADYASILVDCKDSSYKDWKIANYEVTQYIFEKLMGYNPSTEQNPLLPVNNINFYEIMAFCNRLSIAAGLTPVYTIKKSTNPDDWGPPPSQKDKDWEKFKENKKANGYSICKSTNGSSFCVKITDIEYSSVDDYWKVYQRSKAKLWEKKENCTFRVAKKK